LVSAAAGNKSATQPPLPPPACAMENGKKQAQKLVGWDKGSLTEQQTEGIRNNNGTNKEKTQQ